MSQTLSSIEQQVPFPRRSKPSFFVIDVGGEVSRVGLFTSSGELAWAEEYKTINSKGFAGPTEELQAKLTDQIANKIKELHSKHPDIELNYVGLSLCGPLSSEGSVLKLPTVWGDQGYDYPIVRELRRRLSAQWVALNDTTAAAMRYAEVYKYDERICVINVGSGMGNKVYDRNLRNVLLTHDGLGGELGHVTVDFSDDALVCDCGQKGHLNAYVSARGMAGLAKSLTTDRRTAAEFSSCREFQRTQLETDIDKISRYISLAAQSSPLDPFISWVLDRSTRLLAQQLHTLEKGIGIDRFVITGTFARSLGNNLVSFLKDNFEKVVGKDYFNRTPKQMESLIVPGEKDDNDGLIGVGMYTHTMLVRGTFVASDEQGVHRTKDLHGNDVFKVVTPKREAYKITFADEVFRPDNETLAGDYCKGKKVLVVLAKHLQARKEEIRAYFDYHKNTGLITDFTIFVVPANNVTKHIRNVLRIVAVAEGFGLGRRDLFIAVGGGSLMDMAGLAAAMYRRAAAYVRVPMTLTGMVNAARLGGRVPVNFTDSRHIRHKNLLGMFHQPTACLIDRSALRAFSELQIAHGLSEMIKVALIGDDQLFRDIETHYAASVGGDGNATTALLNSSINVGLDQSQNGMDAHPNVLPVQEFTYEIGRMIEEATGFSMHQMEASTIAMAFLATLSHIELGLTRFELERVLYLIRNIKLRLYDSVLDPELLWERLRSFIKDTHKEGFMVIPQSIGCRGYLNINKITKDDVAQATDLLLRFSYMGVAGTSLPATSAHSSSGAGSAQRTELAPWIMSEEAVEYKVEHVRGLFDRMNPKLAATYCKHKKVLVVADAYPDNRISDIKAYFEYYNGQGIVDDLAIMPLTVTNADKTMARVMEVIDKATIFALTKDDLFVVVGGGAISDVVGFAAALYDGGTPYIKIPTTLVGLIDAGIGVKVGVNFKDHKNFIGAYCAPVTCLNDESFLKTLSVRDMRCGIAEMIKMALVKDRRLFELIESKQADFQNKTSYDETEEIIRRSIGAMLDELQPNLYEGNLRRLPDFGHEFGHIIEAFNNYRLAHGEAIAIGMGISCYIAYLKGRFAKRDLTRTLTLLLDVGLPIYDSSCDIELLWKKMCGEAVAHKGGKLYLVIPETIGDGGFIDELADINRQMLTDAVRGLERYATWHAAKQALITTGLNDATVRAARRNFVFSGENGPKPLGYLRPTGISLPITDRNIRGTLKHKTHLLGQLVESLLVEVDPNLRWQIYYAPDDEIHITLVNYSSYRLPHLPFELIPEEKVPLAETIMSGYGPVRGRVKGLYLDMYGVIKAQVIADEYPIDKIREELIRELEISPELSFTNDVWITLGRVLTNCHLSPSKVERISELIEEELLDYDFGEVVLTYGQTTTGHTLFFGCGAAVS